MMPGHDKHLDAMDDEVLATTARMIAVLIRAFNEDMNHASTARLLDTLADRLDPPEQEEDA